MKTRIHILLLLAMLLGGAQGPVHAQSSAQAGDALELQSDSGKRKLIKKGSRVALYGPQGTVPAKGRLLAIGDTLVLESNRGEELARVPTSTVTALRYYRVGFQIIAGYYAFQMLFSLISLGIVIASATGGFPLALIVLASIPGLLGSFGIVYLFAWLGARKFASPKWKILPPRK